MAAIPGFIQIASDDFNRADVSPIAGNWTCTSWSPGRFQILSTHVEVAVNSTVDSEVYYSAWTGGDDHYSQVDITAIVTSAGVGGGPCVRHINSAAAQTCYRLVVDHGGNFELMKFVTGSPTSLRTGTVTYAAGTKLGLSVTGSSTTTLKIWYGGVQIGTDVTDSSSPLTTGLPGLAYSSTDSGTIYDNWDAGIPDTGTVLFKNALKPYPFQPSPR